MAQYYYLVASLPMLLFDAAPPFPSQAWLDLCREQVAADDHALLTRISFDTLAMRPGDPAVWRAYASWETALRNELALLRAQKLNRNPEAFLRPAPFYTGLSALAKEALGAGTPMAVETALDRGRWSRLDELEAGTQFDLGRLVIYRLKLLLLERRQRFRPRPGRDSFAREYARILGSAFAWAGAAPPPLGAEKSND